MNPFDEQSPCQIKRNEVSWVLTKKLDAFAGPGEIKKREVVLDPLVSPEEIKSREVELGSKVCTSFASVVFQQWCYGHCLCDCSTQQLGQQLRSTVVAVPCRRTGTALTVCCSGGGPRHPWSSGLAPVSSLHSSSSPSPLVPVPNRPPRLRTR